MKIGLLTYYGDLNFGTNMQAYATLKSLKEIYSNDIVLIIPFHGFRNRLLPYKTVSIPSVFRDIRRIKKYMDFKKTFLGIRGEDVVIKDVEKALKYIISFKSDILYVGADTILELDRLPKGYDGLSAYWLKDVKALKIPLAASSKNVDFCDLSDYRRSLMKEAISQFSYIGVRDMATKALFNHFVEDNRLFYVPDPTFTLDIDYSFSERYWKKKGGKPEKSRTVLVHPYKHEPWLDTFIQTLKRKGYIIASMRPKSWADMVLNDLGPMEQAGIYKDFGCVITHRFHDSIFCLKNKTHFLLYAVSSNYMTSDGESKQTSILKDFDLFPTIFLGYTDKGIDIKHVEECFNNLEHFFDFSIIEKKLIEKKKLYISFLEKTSSIL